MDRRVYVPKDKVAFLRFFGLRTSLPCGLRPRSEVAPSVWQVSRGVGAPREINHGNEYIMEERGGRYYG